MLEILRTCLAMIVFFCSTYCGYRYWANFLEREVGEEETNKHWLARYMWLFLAMIGVLLFNSIQ